MSEPRSSQVYHGYTWTVIALGVITTLLAAFAAVTNPTPVQWQVALAVLVVHTLLRFFVELRLPGDLYKGGIETAPTFVAEGLAVLVLPWQYAVLTSAIVCGIDAYRHRSEPRDARLLMMLTSPFTTGVAAVTLGWVNLTGSAAFAWPNVLVAAAVLALCCCTLDEGLIWHWYALKPAERGELTYRQRLANVWEDWRVTAGYYPHFVGIALLLAYALQLERWAVFLIVLTSVVTIFWGIALLPHTFARFIRELKEVADLIEERDAYTRGHVDRVAMWAGYIALKRGLSWWQVLTVILVAILHDIGKVTVPDGVLLKPGKLTYTEYRVIQTHVCDQFTPDWPLFYLLLGLLGPDDLAELVLDATYGVGFYAQHVAPNRLRQWIRQPGQRWRRHLVITGARWLLRVVSFFAPFFHAFLERRLHHEKLSKDRAERKGYPLGLCGDEIGLVSLIIEVCDMGDALSSDRPYHEGAKGKPLPEVRDIVTECRVLELDPTLADTFLALVRVPAEVAQLAPNIALTERWLCKQQRSVSDDKALLRVATFGRGDDPQAHERRSVLSQYLRNRPIVANDPNPGLDAVLGRYTLTTVPDQAPALLGLATLLTLLGAWLLSDASAPGWTIVTLGLIAGTQLLSFVRLRLLEWQLTYVLNRLRAAVAAQATTTLSPPNELNGSKGRRPTN